MIDINLSGTISYLEARQSRSLYVHIDIFRVVVSQKVFFFFFFAHDPIEYE